MGMGSTYKLLTGLVFFILIFGTASPTLNSFAQTATHAPSITSKSNPWILKLHDNDTNETVSGPNNVVIPSIKGTGDFVHETDFKNPDGSVAACQSGIGVGIAFDGHNLWFSCYASTPDLYRADPVTGVVTASYNIQSGTGALAYDKVHNVIYAGSAPGFNITRIDLDANQNVVGHEGIISGVPNDFSIDDGLAYDSSDQTLYYSPDVSTTIYHYDLAGNLLDSFPWAGNACYNSGLAIGGNDLYEGSDGCNHVWVVDKVTKAPVFDFTTLTSPNPVRDEDLECDSVTFANQGKEVMWSQEAYEPRRAVAYEIPPGTCETGGVLPPLGSISGIKINETDGDGILNNGENTVAGVQICLDRVNAVLGVTGHVGCTTTNQTGQYYFANLFAGFYKVTETTPQGTIQTFPPNNQPNFVTLNIGVNKTNVNFGNTPGTPGSIEGVKFNDANQNGMQDNGENGISGILICLNNRDHCITTDNNGNYTFVNLPPGTYRVYEPQNQGGAGSINTTPLTQTVTVGVGQNVTNINFGNTNPTPPPVAVNIPSQNNFDVEGLPSVYWANPQTITKDVSADCGGDTPAAVQATVTFSESGFSTSQLMTRVDDSSTWTVTFPPFYPHHGLIVLSFLIDCPPATPGFPGVTDGDDEIDQGGNIYVDPSGYIVDTNGHPISGATVTILKESPPGSGNYILPFTNETIPSTNPETTAANGSYGWVVVPGTWKVSADKSGFAQNFSQPVVIPPAVTNLNVTLSAEQFCGKPLAQYDAFINGTSGDDILVGTGGNDLILGNGGNDRIFGKAGNDCIFALGNGNGYISGGAGNDTITTGDGASKIWGGGGNDNIIVGNGNNRIVGGTSSGLQGDNMTLGTGNNMVWAGPGSIGHTTMHGGGGYNICVAYSGDTTGMAICNLLYVK